MRQHHDIPPHDPHGAGPHERRRRRPHPDGEFGHGAEWRGRGRRGGWGPGFGGHPGAPFGPGDFGPGGFGPRPGGGRARRGDVRAAILGLLAEGPHTGYALIQGIEAKSEGVWRPSPGSVYPTLAQLVDEGLIDSSGAEGKRSEYTLTDEGRAWVESHAEELARAWEGPFAGGRAQREEYRAYRESVGKLMRVIGQFPADANPEQRAAAVEKMDELRRALYALLAE
ncbi:MAG: PadR family transcriptional regulator [Actinomycetales bacterium]|nr:PadR family transcriptional regulator [Actinomycetales bacterium]